MGAPCGWGDKIHTPETAAASLGSSQSGLNEFSQLSDFKESWEAPRGGGFSKGVGLGYKAWIQRKAGKLKAGWGYQCG